MVEPGFQFSSGGEKKPGLVKVLCHSVHCLAMPWFFDSTNQHEDFDCKMMVLAATPVNHFDNMHFDNGYFLAVGSSDMAS